MKIWKFIDTQSSLLLLLQKFAYCADMVVLQNRKNGLIRRMSCATYFISNNNFVMTQIVICIRKSIAYCNIVSFDIVETVLKL